MYRAAGHVYMLDHRHQNLLLRSVFLLFFFIFKNVLVSIRRPETLKEFCLAKVPFVILIYALKENLDFFFFQPYVKSNQGLLKLLKTDRGWAVSIDHFKALLYREIVVHKVIANLLKNPAFPLISELRIRLV